MLTDSISCWLIYIFWWQHNSLKGEKHCIKQSSLAKSLIVYFFTSSQDIYPATLFTGQRLRGRQNQSGSFSFLRIWVELSKEKVFAFTLHTNVAPKRKMYWEENLLEAFRCKLLFWYTSEKQRLSEKVKLCHNAM